MSFNRLFLLWVLINRLFSYQAAASHATQTVLVEAVPRPFTARPDPTPQVPVHHVERV